MRVSAPTADVTTLTSASGRWSHMSAIMFAYEILVVTKVLIAILASSALTQVMRCTSGLLSTAAG